jgi:hypothetical protein
MVARGCARVVIQCPAGPGGGRPEGRGGYVRLSGLMPVCRAGPVDGSGVGSEVSQEWERVRWVWGGWGQWRRGVSEAGAWVRWRVAGQYSYRPSSRV